MVRAKAISLSVLASLRRKVEPVTEIGVPYLTRVVRVLAAGRERYFGGSMAFFQKPCQENCALKHLNRFKAKRRSPLERYAV
jgi:hypothetical protein